LFVVSPSPAPRLSPPPTTSRLFQSDIIFIRHVWSVENKTKKKTSTQTQKKVKLKTCITDNIAQENQCEYNMSIVVIVVSSSLVLLASSLNEGRRLQDRGPSSHKLPSFLRFLLSFFPAAVPFCSCVGDSFATQEFVFFFFLGFFGGLFFSCFSRFFVRATDGVPLFLNGFVEEHRTALASPSRAQFQARTVYRISEYLTSQFSHAYSGLGICHQYFGPYLPQRSCLNVNILKITSFFFYQTYFLR
jgi:hypothetical protein